MMQEEIVYYCQECDAKITIDQLALLNEGKCPTCQSNLGFSTSPRDENDGFDKAVVLNDTDFLEKEF
jgi:transcription initiation factor IIE alpha subunit